MIHGAESVEPRRKSGMIVPRERPSYARPNGASRNRWRRNQHLPLWWRLLNLAFRNVS